MLLGDSLCFFRKLVRRYMLLLDKEMKRAKEKVQNPVPDHNLEKSPECEKRVKKARKQ